MRKTYSFLYIHDDRQSAALLQEILKKYTTIELLLVKSGEKGIETARKEIPDVIFIDTHLPKMNGFSVAKILHRDQCFANTRLIAICDNKEAETVEKCRKYGFIDVLEKPISHADLNHIIDKLK